MTGSSWNPPTGPPNDAPVSAAEARHQIDGAIAAARSRDAELRAVVAEAVRQRVLTTERLPVATEDAVDARSLARRALEQSNEAARAGQRADAARLAGAAQVFALRLRAARDEVARLERELGTLAERIDVTERAVAENVGRLQAVAAARLPVLRGRKASRAQAEVDATVAELRRPLDDVVAQATRAAEAEAAEAAEGGAAGEAGDGAPAVAVAVDDLERELDFDSADDILAELRSDLDLGPRPATDDDTSADGGEDATADPGAEADAADADAPGGPPPGPGEADGAGGSSDEAAGADGDPAIAAGPVEAGAGAAVDAGEPDADRPAGAARRQGHGDRRSESATRSAPARARSWPVPARQR